MEDLIIKDESSFDTQLNNYQKGNEEEIVKVLSQVFGTSWNNIEYWRWKHCNRPGFNEREIVTARVDGKLVGCFHGAVLPLKLEPGIVVPMSFDGDFAILPEHRGRHIPARAHDITDRRLKEAGVALRGGFTSRELNERFYNKQFGYVFIPTASINFRKVIGIKSLLYKIEELGDKCIANPDFIKAIEDQPMIFNFEVDGFPPFHLHMSRKAFRLHDSFSDQANVYIKVPYAVIMHVSIGLAPLIKSSVTSLLKGQLRSRGVLRERRRLFKLLWVALKIRK